MQLNTGAGDAEKRILKDAHRLVNAWEFAKLVRLAASSGHYVIAVS